MISPILLYTILSFAHVIKLTSNDLVYTTLLYYHRIECTDMHDYTNLGTSSSYKWFTTSVAMVSPTLHHAHLSSALLHSDASIVILKLREYIENQF